MSEGEITRLLREARDGDREAEEKLAQRILPELHRRASLLMANERKDHTLQPTALVNEAYLRLVRIDQMDWEGRTQFFAVASRLMRRVLIDAARAKSSEKRGGSLIRVELADEDAVSPWRDEDAIAVSHALERLNALDPRQAEIVVLRFFGGLTVADVAKVMKLSKRTIEGEWAMARAWLRRELSKGDEL